jgi:hypothetical protein
VKKLLDKAAIAIAWAKTPAGRGKLWDLIGVLTGIYVALHQAGF